VQGGESKFQKGIKERRRTRSNIMHNKTGGGITRKRTIGKRGEKTRRETLRESSFFSKEKGTIGGPERTSEKNEVKLETKKKKVGALGSLNKRYKIRKLIIHPK